MYCFGYSYFKKNYIKSPAVKCQYRIGNKLRNIDDILPVLRIKRHHSISLPK